MMLWEWNSKIVSYQIILGLPIKRLGIMEYEQVEAKIFYNKFVRQVWFKVIVIPISKGEKCGRKEKLVRTRTLSRF